MQQYGEIKQEKYYPIDIDKIQTVEDLKYIMLSMLVEDKSQSIGISENYAYFDKIKHLIKEEED